MIIDNAMFDNGGLNCSNFQVNTDEDYFYLDNGYRSLWRLSKKIDISFKDLCIGLMRNGQITFTFNVDGSKGSITKI